MKLDQAMDNDENQHLTFYVMCQSRDTVIHATRLHSLEYFGLLTFDPLYVLLFYCFDTFPYHYYVKENAEDAVCHKEELSGGRTVSCYHDNERDCCKYFKGNSNELLIE